jgi:hypothetical protein
MYIYIHMYLYLCIYILQEVYVYNIHIYINIGSINNTKASWSSSNTIKRPKDQFDNDNNKVRL